METNEPGVQKKGLNWAVLVPIIGGLMLSVTMLSVIGSIFLDVVGKDAKGELHNSATGCSINETCWTAQVKFTPVNGDEITIYPLQNQWPFSLDGILQAGELVGASKIVNIKYLESSPYFAKISLAWHLEYANRIEWLFWGTIVSLIGWIMIRNKPIVLDLSKRNE